MASDESEGPAQPPPSDEASTAGPGVVGWIGRIGAPLAALLVYLLLPSGPEADLSDAGRAAAAIGVLMAIAWMTEALPLPATSLLPIALFPLAGVRDIGEATAPYAHKFIFLFMGGFMIALAMEKWSLHRRIALRILLMVGTRPTRLIGGFMGATAFLSMWISNTATAVMMLPIAISVIELVEERLSGDGARPAGVRNFALCLLLGVAYSASIGGVGTLIGTPPNVFLAGYLAESGRADLSFADWLPIGLPFALVFLVVAWLLMTRVLFSIPFRDIPGGRALIADQLRAMGPPSRGEKIVLGVFVATALTLIGRDPLTEWRWLIERAPAIADLDDAGVVIIASLLLFAIPVEARRGVFALDWKTAVRLPWGVLLLFGGGLSLAGAVQATGLDAWIGQQIAFVGDLPPVIGVGVVALVVIFLTEVTSNTATAATFLPILGGLATAIGLDPALLVIPAAIAASCAFMMPVATPPNAIVFGSGRVRIAEMVKAGIWLNLVGTILVTITAFTLSPLIVRTALPDPPPEILERMEGQQSEQGGGAPPAADPGEKSP